MLQSGTKDDRMKKCLLAALALLVLAACSNADLLNATIPRDGYRITRDVAYGDLPRQKLDIYIPDNLTQPAPVIVFFYGGSWQTGSKDMYRFVGQAFASRGYITVIADYRLYPEVYFPAFAEDGARAFRWVHDNIALYHGDPRNFYLAGHSAGGHIAAMLTTDPHYLRAAGIPAGAIRGMIGLAGPYDFLPLTDPKIIALFSKTPIEQTQPVHYVTPHSPKLPPIFLARGDADDVVGARNNTSLAAHARAVGTDVEMKLYPDVGHIGLVLALADGFRHKAPLLDDVDAFIQRTRQ